MKARIEDFLATKSLSANSLKSYRYDLSQFCEAVGQGLSEERLQLYQAGLLGLKPSAQKRKLSAVNQFLLYLYQEGQVSQYYRLTSSVKLPKPDKENNLLDLEVFFQETDQKTGQLMALLIWQLGLTSAELLTLKVQDINLDFQIVRVNRAGQVRILPLPEKVLSFLELDQDQVYLFDRAGKPYSRQWLARTLSDYLVSLGLGDLTANSLREQFILAAIDQGRSAQDIAKSLGLKTSLTLEKYYK